MIVWLHTIYPREDQNRLEVTTSLSMDLSPLQGHGRDQWSRTKWQCRNEDDSGPDPDVSAGNLCLCRKIPVYRALGPRAADDDVGSLQYDILQLIAWERSSARGLGGLWEDLDILGDLTSIDDDYDIVLAHMAEKIK